MILSDLIGSPVVAGGTLVGRVADLRFQLDDGPEDDRVPTARLYGIVVGPRPPASFLGYERVGVSRPWPIAQILRWRERGSFLVLWADVAQLSADGVLLRPEARRLSCRLPPAGVTEEKPCPREFRIDQRRG